VLRPRLPLLARHETRCTWIRGTRALSRAVAEIDTCSFVVSCFSHRSSSHSTPPYGPCTSDPLDVTSLQEYMQFASITDNLAAELGGRDNGWRPLQPEGSTQGLISVVSPLVLPFFVVVVFVQALDEIPFACCCKYRASFAHCLSRTTSCALDHTRIVSSMEQNSTGCFLTLSSTVTGVS
jgi:hypothetical protein